ncbi:MAG TPA: response regulator [Blastocatellia bacterium]|nr:response regulator [Blastocatellia bacterium]
MINPASVASSGHQNMDAQSRKLIASGIEPVDELMGGLEFGQLYLAHGEAAGKSLFGIKFLIEGLKRNENGALVIRYSPEDAVRRFARLGYDCLEDVYSGRLVILEYSDDIIQKIGKLRELTPVLRELEWLLGETRPERLVFDPVTSVLTGTEGSFASRANEFGDWARSFGATVVLTADESNREVLDSFEPLVAESFRFDLRELGDHTGRFIAFEKSLTISDQAIEVDPSRGVFLLGSPVDPAAPQAPSIAELELIREEIRSVRNRIDKNVEVEAFSDVDLLGEEASDVRRIAREANREESSSTASYPNDLQTRRLTPIESREATSRASAKPEKAPQIDEFDFLFEELTPDSELRHKKVDDRLDELSDLLDDLSGSAAPLDLDLPELRTQQSAEKKRDGRTIAVSSNQPADDLRKTETGSGRVQTEARDLRTDAASTMPRAPRHSRASDLRIDSAIATRAAELLLRPPDASVETNTPAARPAPERNAPEIRQQGAEIEVNASECSVLIIEDDPDTCDQITQTLADYALEVVHDGVSALAKLISFKPDLIILDFDLPVIDGFKVLTLMRMSLNVPIIIISGSRMRAVDRVMASELGADYFLTKPFSAKELKHKARQLIARYRGISSWIITPAIGSPGPSERATESPATSQPVARDLFRPYKEFAADVEERVKTAMSGGSPFSIVGCRLPRMTANGGRVAVRLFEIAVALVREADRVSTNSRNDLVILLANAGTAGAKAFAGRLRERALEELNQEPALWMRSFPELEEKTEATEPVAKDAQDGMLNRRSSDKPQGRADSPPQSDPRDSYIDFLERL